MRKYICPNCGFRYSFQTHKDGRKRSCKNCGCKQVYSSRAVLESIIMDKVRQEVVELPIAFDKEKVIEELKQEAENSRKTWNRFGGEDAIGEMNAYIRAIDIVEKVVD